jgi:hypothetical protein
VRTKAAWAQKVNNCRGLIHVTPIDDQNLVTVTADMVKAATELYEHHFFEWQLCKSSLERLEGFFPEWDEESCLIKAVAINELYGTNVYLIVPFARSITEFMNTNPARDMSLVYRLAVHPVTKKRHVSFASKLCHFFVDKEQYPIFDGIACETLRHFLRKDYVSGENRYESFVENLRRLRCRSSDLMSAKIGNAELDHFLWLFGLWKRAQNGYSKINSEAKRVFANPPKGIIRRLVAGSTPGCGGRSK